ncbi:MAG TPA: PVC-type heme-binding CxxCH protein, partial [Planctomycetaceae bacterium]|nr:PVC-type heme-binding CxxCH protein [Planctomycetaceae bacterium]
DFWRSVYDKIPEPPPNHIKGADRISIHEDTDGDGTYDSHKTFLEGLSIASSFARGRGGVFVLNPPYLLFYPDRDNDDAPDGDPEVLLRGFGMEDTHSVANSLRWGPDGWLYAAQGSTVSGNISKMGEEKKAVHSMGQLIWRYHPERRIYEIFAEGGGNTFGVEIDSKGRIYSGHNGGDTRGFHYVQGAYYRKGFGKHGPLSNPYSFGYFEHIKHHSVPRFTHNFIIYEDPALPKRYHGKLFGIEPLQGQVVQSNFQPLGSSFQTEDINRPITSTDRRFRPVDIKLGPDGAIYVADLYEPQISHREHFAGQIDKRNGRVYRLKARGQAPLEPFDLSKLTSAELVEKLKHPNKWFRQQTLRLLGDRKDDSIIPALRLQIESGPGQTSLEALWALYQTGGLSEAYAGKLLGHVDPFVRLWTARLLCDENQVPAALAYKLAEMARIETNVEVRVQLACSAKRLPADAALPIVVNLLRHEADASDVFMPLLLWWA